LIATQILKKLVPHQLRGFLKQAMGFQTMEGRLLNLRRAGFTCTGAIDVGAYRGEWSKSLRSVWDAPLILVEPQPLCSKYLEPFAANESAQPAHLEHCALGRETGAVEFLLDETNSRMLLQGKIDGAPSIHVPVTTLLEVTSRYPENYNLLKADVQGFELDVLDGAGDQLQRFEIIILEVSIIRIGPVPTFFEVLQYMDGRGYRLYDFLPMYYRPLDNALWQGDAFFVRNDSQLVSSLSWG
jgi:FkbM family methyltransferase